MKNQFLFFLLLFSSFSSAQIIQDWDLSPLGQRTYFERDNGFLEMYYNDSTEIFADYRKHYFGEKYTKDVFHGCYEEIQNYLNSSSYYLDYFYPSFEEHFAVEEWYSNDSFYYVLNQNDTIQFFHKAPIDFTWKIPVIHEDFDEIKFECTQITEQDVFGTLDSVRIFQITTFQNSSPINSPINLREIYLSKNHGLLNFTPFYRWLKGFHSWTGEEQFNISGFEKNNEVNGLIPEFDLFFENYAVGDIFKWNKQVINIPNPSTHQLRRDSIVALTFYPDSLIEITFDRKFQINYPDSIVCFEQSEVTEIFTKPDFEALFDVAPRHLFGGNFTSLSTYNRVFHLESIQKNDEGKLTFKISSLISYLFNNCENVIATEEWYEQEYQSDIGLTYVYNDAMFSQITDQLVGYKTNNLSYGDYTQLCLAISNNNTLTNNTPSITIYPNPTSNQLNFIFSKNQNQPFSFLIYDALGKLVLEKRKTTAQSIDISNLKKGFYFVKISSSFEESVHKIVKQ